MDKRLDRLARGLLRPINPYVTLIVGAFTAVWGIWLLLPEWSVFGSAKIFTRMAEFAPEWAWGSWALACGVLIIWAVIKGLYRILSNVLLFAIWHWGTVSGMMWWSDWHNTGGITYTFVCLTCIYYFLNIHINYVKYGEDIPFF